MNDISKTLLVSALLLLPAAGLRAQENADLQAQDSVGVPAKEKVKVDISADIVSHYVWRGMDEGNVSLQPCFELSYKGLSLSCDGNVGLSNWKDGKELNWTLSYTVGGLTLAVIDYWLEGGSDESNRYFKYTKNTNHVFEASVGYDFGPVALQWYTNFAGDDGLSPSGKRAYSSYLEATAPFRLWTVDWLATAACVPYATDYYETNGFAVTNLALRATKEIRITDSFGIPIFAEFIGNPRTEKLYFVLGITLQP